MKYVLAVSLLFISSAALSVDELRIGIVMPPQQVSADQQKFNDLLDLSDQFTKLKVPGALDALQSAMAADVNTLKEATLDHVNQLKSLIIQQGVVKKDIDLTMRGMNDLSALDLAISAGDKDFVETLMNALAPQDVKIAMISRGLRFAFGLALIETLFAEATTSKAAMYMDLAQMLIKNGAVTGIDKLDRQLKDIRSADDVMNIVSSLALDTIYKLITGVCQTEAVPDTLKQTTSDVLGKIKNHHMMQNLRQRAKHVRGRLKEHKQPR